MLGTFGGRKFPILILNLMLYLFESVYWSELTRYYNIVLIVYGVPCGTTHEHDLLLALLELSALVGCNEMSIFRCEILYSSL